MAKKVNTADIRRRFKNTARQIRSGNPLRQDQLAYLADAFDRIGDGADANDVFGLKKIRGEKNSTIEARKDISLVLSLVAAYRSPEEDGGYGLSLDQSFIKASQAFPEYSPETLERYWRQQDKKHMRNIDRKSEDQDNPFE